MNRRSNQHHPRAGSAPAMPGADLLHLGKYYPPEPGGIEQVVRSVIDATRGHLTHHALIAARTGSSRIEEVPGARLQYLRQWGTLLLAPILPTLPWVLHRLRRSRGYPVLLLHLPNPVAIVALALSLLVLPKHEKLVIWHHADALFDAAWKRFIHRLYLPFERYVFRRADSFLAATPHHVETSPLLRSHRDRTAIVPYAIDPDWFESGADLQQEADTLRELLGGRFVLFVGRLAAYKGLDVLLDAAPEIGAQVVLIGSGPEERRLRQEIRARRLEDKIRLLGQVESLKPYFAACELLVLPSSSALEAFGLVQVEAMALGKPVVSSNLPTGVTWVNRDGATGLTFPVGDAKALAAACDRLLDDEALRRRLGEQARERARQEFSYSALNTHMVAIVQSLAGAAAS